MECEDSGPYTAPPPGRGELFIFGMSLTNGKTQDKTQLSRQGMEGLPTFRHGDKLLTHTHTQVPKPSDTFLQPWLPVT